jgi:membrane protein implicated in regulation of membrane protease activity
MIRPFRNRRESAAPVLLVAFFAATLAMVIAVVVLLRGTNDWVDFVAIALLFAFAAVLLMVQLRELGEEEPPAEDDDAEEPRAGR